ncbi:MAG TPA: right-handed parallel beta-helix repeat-containing protein [Armatimonadota bacterium]|nr:right-handed parallel beta-helix repeat-containing protein [Armatimonadota bacterium]
MAWRMLASVSIAACLGAGLAEATPARLYVATNGNDAWSGKLARPNRARTDGPFATLQRARDEARKLKAARAKGVVVQMASGVYQLTEPVQFGPEDSGTASCPIEYRAEAKGAARIVCGRIVPKWKPVTDEAALERLPAEAHGKVFVADLASLGVTDLQGINNAETYVSDPGLEVFFQDEPMTLARYPNTGYMHIAAALDAEGNPAAPGAIVQTPDAKFRCDDPRPANWAGEKDVWLHGFWVWDWADLRLPMLSMDAATNTIGLGEGASKGYGLRTGQWFYAQNVMPELDSPGEWYLDRETSKLYFWPPAPLSQGKVMISTVRDPIRLDGASNVVFHGLVVEAGRGTAFVIKGGDNVRVVACTIRNMGNWAVRVNGGTKHGVVGCDIYQTGQGGIYLEGGDRKTLTPAGHYADNNHIHHTSRWDPVYQQAIALRGVGNGATHNLIDNVPHIAIGFADNEMTIEFNEIHSAVFQSNDAGAIYTSPPNETWSMRGHKIRQNYLHNIHGFEGRGCMGVYLDDCFSSADISRNVFYDVATAILIGGGRDNLMSNNLFVNCGRALSIDARGLGWAAGVGTFATQELHDLNYQQPPWSTKYPELVGILEDDPLAPKGNVVARNICWGGEWGWFEPSAQALLTFEDNLIGEDPKFLGKPEDGFRLAPDSPARGIRFQPAHFDRIGVYESPDRASWPVLSELRTER